MLILNIVTLQTQIAPLMLVFILVNAILIGIRSEMRTITINKHLYLYRDWTSFQWLYELYHLIKHRQYTFLNQIQSNVSSNWNTLSYASQLYYLNKRWAGSRQMTLNNLSQFSVIHQISPNWVSGKQRNLNPSLLTSMKRLERCSCSLRCHSFGPLKEIALL